MTTTMLVVKYSTCCLPEYPKYPPNHHHHHHHDHHHYGWKFNLMIILAKIFWYLLLFWLLVHHDVVNAGEECCNTGRIYSDRNECHMIPNINHVQPDRVQCLLQTTYCCLQYSRENFCRKIGQEFMQSRLIQDYLKSVVVVQQQKQPNSTMAMVDLGHFWSMLRSRYQCYSPEDERTFCCIGCTLGFASAINKLVQWDRNKITEKLIRSNLSEWCDVSDSRNKNSNNINTNNHVFGGHGAGGFNNSTRSSSSIMLMGNAAFNACCKETLNAINSSMKWCNVRPAPCAHHCHEAKRGSHQIHCSCWEGYRLAADGRNCVDVDECQERTHDCNDQDEQCFNTIGKYQCLPKTDDWNIMNRHPGLEITGNRNECLPGFYYNHTLDRCKDIDECAAPQYPDYPHPERQYCNPSNQVCVNKLGGYECWTVGQDCPKGFRRMAPSSESDTGCRDIDECKEGKNNCDYLREHCENFIGSFACEPKINKTALMIRDTMALYNMADYDVPLKWPVSDQQTSNNKSAGGSSSCPKGYHFVTFSQQCEDINECKIGQHNCDLSVDDCINFPGTYMCRSDLTTMNETIDTEELIKMQRNKMSEVEHRDSEEDGANDDDDDDNDDGGGGSGGGLDDNSIEDCHEGYARHPVLNICEDIDECRRTQSPCPVNSLCQNTIGSYVCHCKAGFTKNSLGHCEDMDECEQKLSHCPSTMRCINTLGSFECIPALPSNPHRFRNRFPGRCPKGKIFDEINRECIGPEPVNNNRPMIGDQSKRLKCKYGERITNGECKQVICGQGFFYNETDKRCQDMNECLEYSPCLKTEKCTNTIGSYRCGRKCGNGYRLSSNGQSCEDVDECASGQFVCPLDKLCENRRGSYSCECRSGFVAGRDGQCQDIDECAEDGDELMCDLAGTQSCINTVGSYRCQCKQGYRDARHGKRDGISVPSVLKCVDVDECQDPTLNNCQHYCQNYVGSYKCSCTSGYKLSNDGHTCVDEDECSMFQSNLLPEERPDRSPSSALCYYKCVNTPGSFQCTCPPGYESLQNGAICRDIDECEQSDAICEDNQFCLNVRGGYRCVTINCPEGYFFEMKNKKCLLHQEGIMGFSDLSKPISYLFNYLSIVSDIRIPKSLRYFDLVAINGKIFEIPDIRYNLTLTKAIPGRYGVRLAQRDDFILRKPKRDQIVVSLVKPLQGPQDVDLELTISLYPDDKFTGMSKALIYIVVSEYTF